MDEFEERKNTGRVVVAIPTATEPIHHIGDAAEPKHMTVLWLGKPDENPDLDMEAVKDAVRGVAEQAGPLTGRVEGQGPLGDEGAQVAFLAPDGLAETHDMLLADPTLKSGFDAVKQHPQWTPHVTLTYASPDDAPLGHEQISAVPEGDLPQEVIFDRLAVWDGDEHTEFPLGPSASSAETTDVMDRGDFVVKDAVTLAAACVAADNLTDDVMRTATRRVLTRRARMLGCQYVIPTAWIRQATITATAAASAKVDAVMARNVTDVPDLFALKTELSALSDTALRAAYMRGVRDYAMTAPQSRPPLPRDLIAQARVNSLIRLAQGDLSARTDDQDLLS